MRLGCGRAATAPSTRLTVENALAQLDTGDWIMRWEAMNTLARAKATEAVAPLTAIVNSPADPWLRGRAMLALAHIQGKSVFDKTLAAAGSADAGIRASAIEALGVIGDARGKAAVERAMADADPVVKQEALVALARIDPKAAWPVIQKLIAAKNTEWPMLVAATRALEPVRTPEAFAAIAQMLNHRERAARGGRPGDGGACRPPGHTAPAVAHGLRERAHGPAYLPRR